MFDLLILIGLQFVNEQHFISKKITLELNSKVIFFESK